ncbi:elongation of very long chain fatty acids protein 7-like [Uloborus diversus]|uniref:elongation of very long chain fatty acids protein 7-like n=1 Tax=Uloborus diversus TaxID=327109 RepID=UPI0024093583|nr:elongation of very long chain fatty acids protein 7-like [Uloborus diversus]
MEYVAWAFRAPFEGYRWMMDKSDPRTLEWPLCGSPFPMLSLIAGYVYFVKVLGPQWMKDRPPFRIERTIIAYNVAMVVLSAFFFLYGGSFTYIPPWGKFSWFCQPIDYGYEPRVLQMVSLGWWYLMLKIAEFADTVFFVLRKKFDHISALHVIHHSLVAWGVWIGIKFGAGGSNAFFPFLNCFVHTLMYSYYCMAALGMKKHLWWKKHLTILQMVQFVVAFAHGLVPLFHDCGYQKGFAYAIMFHALLFMVMFINFYRNTYHKKQKRLQDDNCNITTEKHQDGHESLRKRQVANGTRRG